MWKDFLWGSKNKVCLEDKEYDEAVGKLRQALSNKEEFLERIRNIDNVFLSSLVPVIGFTLSTLSLSIVRKVWEKKAK